MGTCKDCGKAITSYEIRCSVCKKKNTEQRKYKRRHGHRLKFLKGKKL